MGNLSLQFQLIRQAWNNTRGQNIFKRMSSLSNEYQNEANKYVQNKSEEAQGCSEESLRLAMKTVEKYTSAAGMNIDLEGMLNSYSFNSSSGNLVPARKFEIVSMLNGEKTSKSSYDSSDSNNSSNLFASILDSFSFGMSSIRSMFSGSDVSDRSDNSNLNNDLKKNNEILDIMKAEAAVKKNATIQAEKDKQANMESSLKDSINKCAADNKQKKIEEKEEQLQNEFDIKQEKINEEYNNYNASDEGLEAYAEKQRKIEVENEKAKIQQEYNDKLESVKSQIYADKDQEMAKIKVTEENKCDDICSQADQTYRQESNELDKLSRFLENNDEKSFDEYFVLKEKKELTVAISSFDSRKQAIEKQLAITKDQSEKDSLNNELKELETKFIKETEEIRQKINKEKESLKTDLSTPSGLSILKAERGQKCSNIKTEAEKARDSAIKTAEKDLNTNAEEKIKAAQADLEIMKSQAYEDTENKSLADKEALLNNPEKLKARLMEDRDQAIKNLEEEKESKLAEFKKLADYEEQLEIQSELEKLKASNAKDLRAVTEQAESEEQSTINKIKNELAFKTVFKAAGLFS